MSTSLTKISDIGPFFALSLRKCLPCLRSETTLLPIVMHWNEIYKDNETIEVEQT